MYRKGFDMNLRKNDIFYLCAIIVFSSLLTCHLIEWNYSLNFKPDSFVYLVNALVYAGMQGNIQNYSYSMFLTPVISFLTSILFRLGIVDKIAIMIVTGAIAIFGEIGLYFLFKIRFDEASSFFGCVMFSSFNIVLLNWGTGGIDIAVCSFSIFTLLFMILAVNKNPKYYIPTSIFLIVAIFTKYDALFLIPLLILCYLSKHDIFNLLDLLLTDRTEFKKLAIDYLKSEEFKYILISVFIAIVLFILFCEVIWGYGSNLVFFTQSQQSLNGFNNVNASHSQFYHNEKGFYLRKAPNFFYPYISPEFSLIILVIIAIGLIYSLINILKSRKEYHFKRDYNISSLKYMIIFLIIALVPISIIGFKYISHMVTNIAFLIIFVSILSLADKINLDKDSLNLDVLFLAWFIVFFVFFSFISIKGLRYLIIAMPPVVYFVLRTIETIFYKFKDSNKYKIVLLFVSLILIINCLTFTFEDTVLADERNNTNIHKVYDYLIEHETDYISKNISSDYSYGSRFGTWELKKDVPYIKKDNLDDSNSSYIVSKRDLNLTNYTQVYKSGKIRLYENIN